MMSVLLQESPITFHCPPARVVERNARKIVLTYTGQGQGPFLVDLSHLPRWDLQGRDLSKRKPFGLDVPQAMNAVARQGNVLISRMNPTQCQVWHLSDTGSSAPAVAGCTEISDGQAVLALLGNPLEPVLESLTTLDIYGPGVVAPRLFQGPILGIPCQIVRLDALPGGGLQALLIAFSRGYGQSMADAILKLARPFGLEPGGAQIFNDWLAAAS